MIDFAANGKPLKALLQARDDGLVDPDKAKELSPKLAELQDAMQKRQDLVDKAGGWSAVKAAGLNVASTGVGMAVAPAGAAVGQEVGGYVGGGLAALAGPEAIPVGYVAGKAVGGFLGGAAAFVGGEKAFKAAIKKIGQYSETIDSLNASDELHPVIGAVTGLATMAAGNPEGLAKGAGELFGRGAEAAAKASTVPGESVDAVRAAMNAQKMASQAGTNVVDASGNVVNVTPDVYAHAADLLDSVGKAYANSGGGVVKTIGKLSDMAQTELADGKTATQAAATVAKQVLGSAAGMVAADSMLRVATGQPLTLAGAGQAALLGTFMSGHGLEAKGYNEKEVGNIILSGMAHEKTQTPWGESVDVADLAKAQGVDISNIDNNAAQQLTQALTPEQQEIYRKFNEKMGELVQGGVVPTKLSDIQITAKQMLRNGRTMGVSAVEIRPKTGESDTSLETSGAQSIPGIPQETPSTGSEAAPEPVSTPAAPAFPAPANTQQAPASPDVAGIPAIQQAVMSGQMTHADATAKLAEMGVTDPNDVTRAIGPAPAQEVAPAAPGNPPVASQPRDTNGVVSQETPVGETQAAPSPADAKATKQARNREINGELISLGQEARGLLNGEPSPESEARLKAIDDRQKELVAEAKGGPKAPVSPTNSEAVTPVDEAAHEAATSPENNTPEPTPAQNEAENFKMGHARIGGMDITIKNPAGSVRKGTDADGNQWETPMQDHYGHIRGTVSNDDENLDAFVKPGTPEDYSGPVFVVNQNNADGKFDESKAIVGASSEEEAKQIYLRNYPSGQEQRIHSIAEMPMDQFKEWATSGQKTDPAKVDRMVRESEAEPTPQPQVSATDTGNAAPGLATPGAATTDSVSTGSKPVVKESSTTESTGKQSLQVREPRDATVTEEAASAKAKPVVTRSGKRTGWGTLKGDNIVTLVSADGKKAIDFQNPNPKSGADWLRTQTKAHAYPAQQFLQPLQAYSRDGKGAAKLLPLRRHPGAH